MTCIVPTRIVPEPDKKESDSRIADGRTLFLSMRTVLFSRKRAPFVCCIDVEGVFWIRTDLFFSDVG